MTTSLENRRWYHALGSLPFAVAVLVACNALYIALVAFGNITDYDTNFQFVKHVLSMDTTNFGGTPGQDLDPQIMWRAINNAALWNIAYVALIIWESVAAIVLTASVVLWIRAAVKRTAFDTAKAFSSIGLLMIVVLFFA